MFTTGSKLFFGAAVVAGVSAFLYSSAVDTTRAWFLLASVAVVLGFLGGVVIAFRDADLDVPAAVAPDGQATPARPPLGVRGSMWPLIGGFGAAITAIGLVLDERMFVLGLIVVGATTVEWVFMNWADEASGDDAYNESIRGRLAHALEFPILAAMVFAVVILNFSRVMLAMSRVGSIVAFGAVGVAILVGAVLVVSSGRWRRIVAVVLLTVGGVVAVTAGIVAAAIGPRQIEEGGEKPDANSKTVGAKADVFAELVLENGQLNQTQLVLGKGITASILFTNKEDGDRKVVIESFTVSNDPDGKAVRTPYLIESGYAGQGDQQYLTFSLPQPGNYPMSVEGGPTPVTGKIVVP
jgi:hypothetical protein